jgi:hypothetical protein
MFVVVSAAWLAAAVRFRQSADAAVNGRAVAWKGNAREGQMGGTQQKFVIV